MSDGPRLARRAPGRPRRCGLPPSAHGRNGWRPGRAFTLIEIMVVLAIISLITALILPKVTRWPSGVATRLATAQVTRAFSRAALGARARGVTMLLVADLAPDDENRLCRLRLVPAGTGGSTLSVTADAEDLQEQSAAAAGQGQGEAGDPAASTTSGGAVQLMASDRGATMEISERLGVHWESDSGQVIPPQERVFWFFPDGEAAGTPFRLLIGKRRLAFDVCRLTGRLTWSELDQ